LVGRGKWVNSNGNVISKKLQCQEDLLFPEAFEIERRDHQNASYENVLAVIDFHLSCLKPWLHGGVV
jgi:hypothetical protein